MHANNRATSALMKSVKRSKKVPHDHVYLQSILKSSIKGQTEKPLIFLHPHEEGRDYTDDEVEALKKRDFETRIFVAAANIMTEDTVGFGGRTIFVRNHFSDNADFTCWLNYVRDYFKAAHVTKNHTGARIVLADMLTMCFKQSSSDYLTFATTMASGLSRYAKNTSFEAHPGMIEGKENVPGARLKFCLLMDVVFNKMSRKRFLIDDSGSNTYRLAHCATKFSQAKSPFLLAISSFLLQVCLTAYVLLENYTEGFEAINYYMMPLACLTFLYSAAVTYPSLCEFKDSYPVYGKVGPLQLMDFFINQILPLILLFSGFMVILIQDSYIEAVLNTAALLFIPEIDDQLPKLIGLNEDGIIMNYLIAEAMNQYDELVFNQSELIPTEGKIDLAMPNINKSIGVQFSDFYLTNIREQGTDLERGTLIQPHIIRNGEAGRGHRIEPSNYVNQHCVITKITWSYTTYNPNTSKPRIGYLKVVKVSGEEVEITRKGASENIGVSDTQHTLEGFFIITQFQMSNDIIKLRLCGSYDAKSFLTAFEYYSLWEMTSATQSRLEKMQSPLKGMDKKKKTGIHLEINEFNNNLDAV